MGDKVLVVEDEATLREMLEYNLQRQGYEVLSAGDGRTAVELALRERPDLLLLDVMLPGLDGLEVCRIVRQEMNVPILMLTARADEVDKIVGLEVGADDYMTKPFSMRELLARVKAMLRRVRLIREEVAEQREGSAPEAPPQRRRPGVRRPAHRSGPAGGDSERAGAAAQTQGIRLVGVFWRATRAWCYRAI
jgi:DNA-binding response OmpR family regulator